MEPRQRHFSLPPDHRMGHFYLHMDPRPQPTQVCPRQPVSPELGDPTRVVHGPFRSPTPLRLFSRGSSLEANPWDPVQSKYPKNSPGSDKTRESLAELSLLEPGVSRFHSCVTPGPWDTIESVEEQRDHGSDKSPRSGFHAHISNSVAHAFPNEVVDDNDDQEDDLNLAAKSLANGNASRFSAGLPRASWPKEDAHQGPNFSLLVLVSLDGQVHTCTLNVRQDEVCQAVALRLHQLYRQRMSTLNYYCRRFVYCQRPKLEIADLQATQPESRYLHTGYNGTGVEYTIRKCRHAGSLGCAFTAPECVGSTAQLTDEYKQCMLRQGCSERVSSLIITSVDDPLLREMRAIVLGVLLPICLLGVVLSQGCLGAVVCIAVTILIMGYKIMDRLTDDFA